MRVAAGLVLVLTLVACERPATQRAAARDVQIVEAIAEGESGSARAQLAPLPIMVGDRAELTIEVRARSEATVEMPEVGETFGPFRVVEANRPPDIPEGDERIWRHVYALRTFESGEADLPEIAVVVDDEALALHLPAVTVQSALAAAGDDAALREVKPPVEVPVPIAARWWWWGAAGAAALLMIAVLWWALRRGRTREAAVAPPLPPHVWARQALDALAVEGLLEAGAFERFYVRLSDIVRQYVERRFHLMAPERTTDEFLREAQTHPALTDVQRVQLQRFLRAADLVKFALHEPTIDEGRAAFDAARAFIDQTAAPMRADPRVQVEMLERRREEVAR